MLISLLTCVVLLVLFTILPLWKQKHWTVRGMDFPRLQFIFFATALLVAQFWLKEVDLVIRVTGAVATFLCLVYQLSWILPYTKLWKKEVPACKQQQEERKLSILTSNVLKPNRNAGALVKMVQKHQPDILVTLESDKWWQKQLEVLESEMPYTVKCPLDNFYGIHLYSRLKLHDQEISFLVENDVPSIHVAIELKTRDKIRAHFLHPAPPSPTENTESTERDAELIVVAKSVAKCKNPVLVTGDLNDVAWSATTRLFRKISGLLDPRVGRGMFNTFHAKFPLMRWPLDHLFHSEHFCLHSIQRLPSIGSDHFPLLTVLGFYPKENQQQVGLEKTEEDKERAKEILAQKEVQQKDVPNPHKL